MLAYQCEEFRTHAKALVSEYGQEENFDSVVKCALVQLLPLYQDEFVQPPDEERQEPKQGST